MKELERPSFWQVFTSVVAGMFGVQSQRKREFDFSRGRFSDYVLVGGVLSVLFVIMVIAVVKVVMHVAGH